MTEKDYDILIDTLLNAPAEYTIEQACIDLGFDFDIRAEQAVYERIFPCYMCGEWHEYCDEIWYPETGAICYKCDMIKVHL